VHFGIKNQTLLRDSNGKWLEVVSIIKVPSANEPRDVVKLLLNYLLLIGSTNDNY
jgi:hypothetical protein